MVSRGVEECWEASGDYEDQAGGDNMAGAHCQVAVCHTGLYILYIVGWSDLALIAFFELEHTGTVQIYMFMKICEKPSNNFRQKEKFKYKLFKNSVFQSKNLDFISLCAKLKSEILEFGTTWQASNFCLQKSLHPNR